MAERKVKGEKNKAGRPPKFDYDNDGYLCGSNAGEKAGSNGQSSG